MKTYKDSDERVEVWRKEDIIVGRSLISQPLTQALSGLVEAYNNLIGLRWGIPIKPGSGVEMILENNWEHARGFALDDAGNWREVLYNGNGHHLNDASIKEEVGENETLKIMDIESYLHYDS